MTGISPLEAARRKVASTAESMQALPERLQAAWKETLSDAARDVCRRE